MDKKLDELLKQVYGKDVVDYAYASPAGKLTKAQAKTALKRLMLEQKLSDATEYKKYYTQLISEAEIKARMDELSEVPLEANFLFEYIENRYQALKQGKGSDD